MEAATPEKVVPPGSSKGLLPFWDEAMFREFLQGKKQLRAYRIDTGCDGMGGAILSLEFLVRAGSTAFRAFCASNVLRVRVHCPATRFSLCRDQTASAAGTFLAHGCQTGRLPSRGSIVP